MLLEEFSAPCHVHTYHTFDVLHFTLPTKVQNVCDDFSDTHKADVRECVCQMMTTCVFQTECNRTALNRTALMHLFPFCLNLCS